MNFKPMLIKVIISSLNATVKLLYLCLVFKGADLTVPNKKNSTPKGQNKNAVMDKVNCIISNYLSIVNMLAFLNMPFLENSTTAPSDIITVILSG